MSGQSQHIVAVAIKHAAAADVLAPIFWRIRRDHPDVRLTMLYCALSRRKLMRASPFYTALFRELGVKELDFLDFASPRVQRAKPLWRRLLTANMWDVPRPGSLGERWMHVTRRLEQRIEASMDSDGILRQLHPDNVLWDHRTVARFAGSRGFLDYLESEHKQTVLLPHAPHHSYADAFTPFDAERGRPLPDYCEYWVPFIDARPWEKLMERRSQFFTTGYPGLDGEWLRWLRRGTARRSGRLRCLFIIREFRGLDSGRAQDDDPFIFSQEEFLGFRDLVAKALSGCGEDIEVVVKPHPSNNFRTVRHAFEDAGFKRLSFTYDSVYAEVPRCDFVISLYSTALLIPAMAGIPVILLNSRVQEHIHDWKAVSDLYGGLRFYLDEPERLGNLLPVVLEAAREGRASEDGWTGDRAHLRTFYPDGALDRCMQRLGLMNS